MARPKYKISASDLRFAYRYLMRALKNDEYIVQGSVRSFQFRQYLERVDLDDDPELESEILNRWCEKTLTPSQWSKLKVSIRKMRYQESNSDITITLKPRAHAVLQKIINEGNAASLSDAVEWLENISR